MSGTTRLIRQNNIATIVDTGVDAETYIPAPSVLWVSSPDTLPFSIPDPNNDGQFIGFDYTGVMAINFKTGELYVSSGNGNLDSWTRAGWASAGFSYYITPGVAATVQIIPVGQNMLFTGGLEIVGTLEIQGRLVEID